MLKSVLILTSNKTVKYLMLSRLFEFCWSFYNLFVLINSPLSQGSRNTFYSYIKIIELVKNIFLLLLVSCLKSNNNFGPFETFVLSKTIWVWAEMFLQVQQTQLLSNFSYNKLKQNFLLQQDQQQCLHKQQTNRHYYQAANITAQYFVNLCSNVKILQFCIFINFLNFQKFENNSLKWKPIWSISEG